MEQIAPPAGVDARESSASILITLLQNGGDSDFPDAPTAPLVEQLRRCVSFVSLSHSLLIHN